MEMGDNKQICRLCLDIVPAGDVVTIGEKKREMMEVLLISIDLHVIDNAVACSRCMEELQSAFEFKSSCFHVDNCISTFVDAEGPVDIKEVFRRDMNGTVMANLNLENRQLCRLCMSLIEGEALECNTTLKDIIANCLPDVDIRTVYEPVVCELCFSRVKKLNKFMNMCREVEQRIDNYCQAATDRAISFSVNLSDLLKFKDYTFRRLIKRGCSNIDGIVLQEPKKEDTAIIEIEEIHIKDELDSCDEMGGSVPSGISDNSRRSGSFKRTRQMGKSAGKGRNHISSDDHMARNRGRKTFGCQECLFKTDRKYILARHAARHKDRSEVEMHKCENCEYQTRHKSHMNRHILTHRDLGVQRKFKCDKCPYETDFKSALSMHNLIHKDKSEVEMHKCGNCEYETRRKSNMMQHLVKHRDPMAERKFKCNTCPYETDFQYVLRRHLLTHKDKSEVKMYKCGNCKYETRYRSSMIHHMVKHRDPREERRFKCDKCSYETDFKSSLRTHNLKHKDKSEVKMHKCENCAYETRRKSHMTSHNLRHMDNSEVKMHKCENCEYETRYKSSMIRHMLKHRHP